MTVLKRQKGNCFEYSTLLCSLLIGVGYDAYVVNGYATRETCLMDERREICPLLKKKEEVRYNIYDFKLVTKFTIGFFFTSQTMNTNAIPEFFKIELRMYTYVAEFSSLYHLCI